MALKKEIALNTFRSGYNCAQSVLSAFTGEMNLDENQAMQTACGFGAGMGRLQETCGAVTGAYMALGVHACRGSSENNEKKEKSYALVQQFSAKFEEIYGTVKCRSLLGCDLRSEEGRQHANENNLYEEVCEKCVADAVRIAEELMAKE